MIGDNMRGHFFISIIDILSWPLLCFELILLIIYIMFPVLISSFKQTVPFFKECFYSFLLLRNVCRGGWTNILKEKVEVVCSVLFIYPLNFVSINYKIWWEFFFAVTLIEQFAYGCPSLCYVWYILVKFWFIVILAALIFLWRIQL